MPPQFSPGSYHHPQAKGNYSSPQAANFLKIYFPPGKRGREKRSKISSYSLLCFTICYSYHYFFLAIFYSVSTSLLSLHDGVHVCQMKLNLKERNNFIRVRNIFKNAYGMAWCISILVEINRARYSVIMV